jgi:basic amino acid/polyamine antiporter, APA family
MTHPRLTRRLGTGDAVVVGLGAMLGTGVFTVLAPAAAAAGGWLLLGLGLAAVVATCNAVSSADLAVAHPESGGSYVYGRERLGHRWGFLAGAAFVAGKTASCAAAALVFATYMAPSAVRPVALAALAGMVMLNLAGVRWTVRGTRVLVGVVLAVLAVAVVVMLVRSGVASAGATAGRAAGRAAGGVASGAAGGTGAGAAGGGTAAGAAGGTAAASAAGPTLPWQVLRSAALLFFAFAGYARIATLGEEVRDPARTLRRAIPVALAITVVVYGAVAVGCLVALGPAALARADAPVAEGVRVVGLSGLVPLVDAGAALATLSVLLSVLVGVSRTGLAMARRRDLPGALASISRRGTPWRADLAVAGAVAVLVLTLHPASAVGLSAFCVLLYYAIANASALRLRPEERRWPRWTAWLGLGGCVTLAATLPPRAVAVGAGLLAAAALARGLVPRLLRRRRRMPAPEA